MAKEIVCFEIDRHKSTLRKESNSIKSSPPEDMMSNAAARETVSSSINKTEKNRTCEQRSCEEMHSRNFDECVVHSKGEAIRQVEVNFSTELKARQHSTNLLKIA